MRSIALLRLKVQFKGFIYVLWIIYQPPACGRYDDTRIIEELTANLVDYLNGGPFVHARKAFSVLYEAVEIEFTVLSHRNGEGDLSYFAQAD